MKVCKTCLIKKELVDFHKKRSGKFKKNAHCKVCVNKLKKDYYINNKDNRKKYYLNNKTCINEYKRIWSNIKYKSDIQFRLKNILRSRVSQVIKYGSTVKDLGCSIKEFKQYIESKFVNDMSWNNYGKWHIDHIIPLCKFNLINKDEFLKAVNYTNLQPLWAVDNLRKGSKDFNE